MSRAKAAPLPWREAANYTLSAARWGAAGEGDVDAEGYPRVAGEAGMRGQLIVEDAGDVCVTRVRGYFVAHRGAGGAPRRTAHRGVGSALSDPYICMPCPK